MKINLFCLILKFGKVLISKKGNKMYTVLALIMILAAILLIVAILVQPSKGDMISGLGGLSGTFSSMFGSRKTMDLLQKITISLATIILVLTLITNIFFVGAKESVVKPVTEGQEMPIQSTPPVPGQMPNAPVPGE